MKSHLERYYHAKNGLGSLRRAQQALWVAFLSVCWVVVSGVSGWTQVASGPAAALAPLIFEKPNSSRFEILWFHPEFHSQIIGNLTPPSRHFSPYEANREGIVVSRLSLAAPFAVYRVAAYLDSVDISSSLPGDENSPLALQLTSKRDNITFHPTDVEFSAPSSGDSTGLVTVFPATSFSGGDSLYVGLQWGDGTPSAPMAGVASNLGGLEAQEYVYRQGGVNQWSAADDLLSVEVEVLSWKPDLAFNFGQGSANSFLKQPHFVVWYASDSATVLEEASASSVISSDTLSWEAAVVAGGVVTIVAEDEQGNQSDTLRAVVPSGSFKKITLSSPEMVFDWRNPTTLSQSIFVTNESIGPVNLLLQADDPRFEFSETALFIGGGRFAVVTVSMTEPPRGPAPELHSLYIYNDSGWLPLKMDMRAISDIQTSVDDDSPKPLTFELSEVYPNPNFGVAQMRIVSPQSKTFKIDIYNVLGQLLQSEERVVFGEEQVAINLAPSAALPLAAGVYFVRISTGNESTMRKMVLVK